MKRSKERKSGGGGGMAKSSVNGYNIFWGKGPSVPLLVMPLLHIDIIRKMIKMF